MVVPDRSSSRRLTKLTATLTTIAGLAYGHTEGLFDGLKLPVNPALLVKNRERDLQVAAGILGCAVGTAVVIPVLRRFENERAHWMEDHSEGQ